MAEADGRDRPTGGRRARRHVAVVMILAALLSALLVGIFNYATGRSLLTTSVNDQLVDVATNRAIRINVGLEAVGNLTSVLALEPTVSEAAVELSAAFSAAEDVLTPDQDGELRNRYGEGIDLITPPGVPQPSVDSLLPSTDIGRYLQYWYVIQAPVEERPAISDPGDGSAYTDVHARYQPVLVDLASSLDLTEVLLVDLDGDVVFSIEKRADFATNLLTGPYRDSALAGAIDQLTSAAVGDVVFVDFEPYPPAQGRPVLWSVTAIRSAGEVAGVLATPIPDEVLVSIVTSGGDWEALGLGETGEVYIVGPDGLLRTEPRQWLEDPDAYLAAMASAGYSDETIEAVRAFGTTVLLQPVDTDPVAAALRGDRYEGTGPNYLGQRTRSVAGPFASGQLGWIVVTEAQTGEIFSALRDYVWRLLIIAALAVPIVIGIAVVIARRMLRPIEPIVEGANRVAAGDIEVTLDMRGNDEFSDLAAQFDAFTAELRSRRDEVIRTDAETTELLGSVMPRRLVEQYKAGERSISEALENACIVSVVVAAHEGAGLTEDDVADYSVGLSAGLDEIAAGLDVERLDSSASTLVYAVGLGSDELEVDEAVRFSAELRRWIDGFIVDGEFPIGVGIGVAAGDVIANVVGTQRIAFEVLGTPRRTSEALARLATPTDVLVDAATAGRLDGWPIERVDDLRMSNGVPLDGWRLAAGDPTTVPD